MQTALNKQLSLKKEILEYRDLGVTVNVNVKNQLNIQTRDWVCPWLTNLTCWLPETGRYKRERNPLYSPCFS